MSPTGMFADVRFTKLHPDAKTPTRAHESDAGNDLYALEDFTIYAGETLLVKTGIAVALPEHAYGQISGRSSLAKNGIFVTGGVIDSSYRGAISVILNSCAGNVMMHYKKGDKIAQLIVLPILEVTWKEVETLDTTVRGSNGFGSSDR